MQLKRCQANINCSPITALDTVGNLDTLIWEETIKKHHSAHTQMHFLSLQKFSYNPDTLEPLWWRLGFNV